MFNSPIVSARYKYVLSLIFSFFDLIDKPSPLDDEKNDFLVTCLGTIIVRRSFTVFFNTVNFYFQFMQVLPLRETPPEEFKKQPGGKDQPKTCEAQNHRPETFFPV